MTKAMHEEHAKALVALADCLTALQATSQELERDPRNATAVRDYNPNSSSGFAAAARLELVFAKVERLQSFSV